MTSTDALVGRQEELALLRRRLASARAGSGHLVVVSGPAGIGKTRLVEELVRDCPVVGWGAGLVDAGMPALWPWVRAVRDWPSPRDAVAALVGGSTQHGYGSAEEAAASTFTADTAVVDALAEQAAASPGLVVVLDDLQWADAATLRLLDRLGAEIRRLPLLVVGTHRDAAALPADRSAEVVNLGPLSPTEAAAMLSTAVEGADQAAIGRAVELSGGSPLYLRTLTKVAVEALRGDRDWDGATGAAPELRHLVAAAMRASGPRVAADIEALSVLGPVMEPDVVARLLGVLSASAVVERLLPAVPAGLMEVHSGDRVRFAHALVRDAAYASLSPSRRTALHRLAAELLEPLAVGRDERAGTVARHWLLAEEPERAVGWAIRAAAAALAAGAYEDAASYLQLALDTGSTADRAELLLDLARALYLAGRIQQSAEACVQAAVEGELSGRAEVVGRAAIVIQGVGHPDVNQRLEDLSRRALRMPDCEMAPELRARVEAQLACALFEREADDEAAQWAADALERATASGDPNAELDAIRAYAWRYRQPRHDPEVIELGQRAIDLAARTARPLSALWAHTWRSDAAIHQADMAWAQRELGEMRTLADRTRLPLVRWHVLRREATIAALVGDFGTSRERSARANEIAGDWQDVSIRFTRFGQSLSLALLRDDPADLMPGWTDFLGGVRGYPLVAQTAMAVGLRLSGRSDEALDLYRSLIGRLDEMRTGLGPPALSYLAELAVAFDDPDGCRGVRTQLEDIFGGAVAIGAGTVAYLGSLGRVLAELDLGCGEISAAVAHYEEGLRVDALLGARPYVALGSLGLARALFASSLPRAVSLARAAAAEARRLDMPGLLRAADAFLTEAAAASRSASPLSPREREVSALVAQALSNRDIASRLVLSERTVESHVRSILAKTGLTTRTELVRWHLEQQDL
ncbi:ATP-binding protein [Tenggerimyces flavus]|uniref:ATP-binding protein n=1 Tax=Tenggerimyces flavus TaxID=1708749 RepID=A0ABV7YH91_9ACTN|nr:LuxR family transcriptional regulator [Tenggerimyces flavus]MBM7784082.1 DNA-binding CsgD family transcriptional regulator [Tenggerimyces flavus]